VKLTTHLQLVQRFRLVFGTFSVRVSAGTPDIITVLLRGFLQSIRANCEIISVTVSFQILSNSSNYVIIRLWIL
jgi:hypothetical protein